MQSSLCRPCSTLMKYKVGCVRACGIRGSVAPATSSTCPMSVFRVVLQTSCVRSFPWVVHEASAKPSIAWRRTKWSSHLSRHKAQGVASWPPFRVSLASSLGFVLRLLLLSDSSKMPQNGSPEAWRKCTIAGTRGHSLGLMASPRQAGSVSKISTAESQSARPTRRRRSLRSRARPRGARGPRAYCNALQELGLK